MKVLMERPLTKACTAGELELFRESATGFALKSDDFSMKESRWDAPTRLTWREHICLVAQRRSRDENPSPSRSLG